VTPNFGAIVPPGQDQEGLVMGTSILQRSADADSIEHIVIKPLTPVIGAVVSGLDLRQPFTQPEQRKIDQALLDWKLLIFKNQQLDDAAQVRFSRQFGPLLDAHPVSAGLPEHPEVWERHAKDYNPRYRPDRTKPTIEGLRDYRGWHTDITFVANPNSITILRGTEVPAYGGDTLWANLEAAYEGLSPAIQRLIENLKGVHRIGGYDFQGASPQGVRNPTAYAAVHPLVRVHPVTRKKSLFVSPGAPKHIVGLHQRESDALLNLLREEVIRPEYAVRVRHEPGAIAVWDNRNTVHAGPIDYAHFSDSRVIHRTIVLGDLPEGPDGFRSYSLNGEPITAIS
jgi:taurine dioxygenase